MVEMHILYLTLIHMFTLAIGFIVGLYINNTRTNWWRKFLGITLGFITSWVLGSLMWLSVALMIEEEVDIPFTLSNAVVSTFWFALFASIYGTYQGHKKNQKNNNVLNKYEAK